MPKIRKTGKWPILDQNHGHKKSQFFDLFELLVFIALKGVFSFYSIRKYIFPDYFAQNKKDGKMAKFVQKLWTNPSGKTSIFRLFELLVLCFPSGGPHITRDTFLLGGGLHNTRDMYFPAGGIHSTWDMCFLGGETDSNRDMLFPDEGNT